MYGVARAAGAAPRPPTAALCRGADAAARTGIQVRHTRPVSPLPSARLLRLSAVPSSLPAQGFGSCGSCWSARRRGAGCCRHRRRWGWRGEGEGVARRRLGRAHVWRAGAGGAGSERLERGGADLRGLDAVAAGGGWGFSKAFARRFWDRDGGAVGEANAAGGAASFAARGSERCRG